MKQLGGMLGKQPEEKSWMWWLEKMKPKQHQMQVFI